MHKNNNNDSFLWNKGKHNHIHIGTMRRPRKTKQKESWFIPFMKQFNRNIRQTV